MLIGTLVLLYHLNLYNTFYCDYFYVSNVIHYTLHGGTSTLGDNSGAFYLTLNVANTEVGWYRGACLSFKLLDLLFIVIIFINQVVHIMFFVVVHLLL